MELVAIKTTTRICRRRYASRLACLLIFSTAGSSAFPQSPHPSTSTVAREENPPYRRDNLESNWNRRGRQVFTGTAAELRLRAYQSKLIMRAVRAAALKSGSLGGINSSASPAFWTPVGPAPLASDATGAGMTGHRMHGVSHVRALLR